MSGENSGRRYSSQPPSYTPEMIKNPRLPTIYLKRVYEAPSPDDGVRLLVERLWPRGLSRDAARIDHWFKDLAPSSDLRRWYAHVPERWPEFKTRYLAELEGARPKEISALASLCQNYPLTFVFAARDEARNSAVVLRGFILQRLQSG